MNSEALPKHTALVTGASSGLGAEFAKLLAADGRDLVLIARRKESMERLARQLQARHPIQVFVLAEDLSRPETPERVARDLGNNELRIDTLVNCAGFGLLGPVASLSLQQQLDMIEVNVTALTKLTRLFLPHMIERGSGGILNVAATTALQPGPNMAIYHATKAYVQSLTEALAFEVRERGIRVCCACPGPTATGFAAVSGYRNAGILRRHPMDAEQTAGKIYRAFQRGKSLAVPGLQNRLGRLTLRAVPRRGARWLLGTLHRSEPVPERN